MDRVHFEISVTTPLRIHAVLRVISTAVRHTGMSRVQVGGSCMIHAGIWTQMCTELMGAHNGHKFSQSCTRVLQLLNCVSWDGKMRENRTEAGTSAILQFTQSPCSHSVHLHWMYMYSYFFLTTLDLKRCCRFYFLQLKWWILWKKEYQVVYEQNPNVQNHLFCCLLVRFLHWGKIAWAHWGTRALLKNTASNFSWNL